MKSLITFRMILTLVLTAYLGSSSAGAETETVWSFENFRNRFTVFGSHTVVVARNRPCPQELGWQGTLLRFVYRYSSTLPEEETRFYFEVDEVFTDQPVDVFVGMRKVAANILVTYPGRYEVAIPHGLLRGRRVIRLKVKGVRVGYGQPTTGFLLSRVGVEIEPAAVEVMKSL